MLMNDYDPNQLCDQCKTLMPERSTHCFDCNRCVDRYDHHCPWMNNCIGRKNFVSYYFYLLTTLVYILASLISSILGKSLIDHLQLITLVLLKVYEQIAADDKEKDILYFADILGYSS